LAIWLGMAAVFGAALLSAYILTPLAERICWHYGLVDQPRKGELQVRPAARAGGYAIVGAFLIALAVSLLLFPRDFAEYVRLAGFLLGVALIIPLALVDDFKRLNPGAQGIGQLAIAVPPVIFGIVIDSIVGPFGSLVEFPLYVALPITVFWTVGMINTLNFIDTMDGLATGIAAIAAAILFARSFDLGQYSIAVLPLALVGACIGFLPYNFSPARIFAGSGGSYFLGYTLAVLAIIGGAKIATALMVLGLPIVDVAVVILRRLLAGRSPFKGGDGAHLVHRLAAAGLPPRLIAFLVYALCALAGGLALSLSSTQKLYLFVVVALVLALIVVALVVKTKRPTAQPDPR
jgi:UDP-GlcNAc:undecaprenyl-phosphate/decaprenyl-phosphate GlcNAc-1-phosphate transferase